MNSEVIPLRREIIEEKLLVALSQEAKVAAVFSEKELRMLLDCFKDRSQLSKEGQELRRDLVKLLEAAFPH